MDVSVIIVNYHTRSLTAACIDSLFEKTEGLTFEVILVDNASTDGSREHFGQDSRIHYVYQEENLGFGRANNVGIGLATGRYVFFLNSDTLLLNNAVKVLADFLDSHPRAGACGGNLFTQDLQPAPSFLRYRPSVYDELNQLLRDVPDRLLFGRNLDFNHTGRPMKVGYITGADLMVRREVLEKTGGFDPSFFMYYEETELCHRMTKRGWQIYSVPEAHIIHLGGASFQPNDEALLRRQQIKYESKQRYMRLCHTPFYTALARLLRRMTIGSKLLFAAPGSERRKKWEGIRQIENGHLR
jgi:GT2 family glycosyltransferase